jgi:hypothetical protein
VFEIGTEVGAAKLRAAYDAYWNLLVRNELELLPSEGTGKKRPQARYRVVGRLPTRAEYEKLKVGKFTVPVEELIADANSAVEEVAGELRDWYDNLPESFQNGDKGERLSEAADTLEGVSQPDTSEEVLAKITAYHQPALKAGSRAARLGEAAGMYRAAAEAIREFVGGHEDDKPDDAGRVHVEFDEGGDKVTVAVDLDALGSAADECDNAADEVEGVEVPGMYG